MPPKKVGGGVLDFISLIFSSLNPCSLIHSFPNRAVYQMAPTKKAIKAATSTASQLILAKSNGTRDPLYVGVARRLVARVRVRRRGWRGDDQSLPSCSKRSK